MPRHKTASCSLCGTPMWATDLAREPTCRACRSTGIRRTTKSTKRIGCKEPQWPHCWTCGSTMERAHGVRYCSRPCQPYEQNKHERAKRDTSCWWCGKAIRREVSKGHAPTCSRFCQMAVTQYKQGNTERAWPRIRHGHHGPAKTAAVKVLIARPCKVCAREFTTECYPGASESAYCSNACRNRWKTTRKSGNKQLRIPRFVSGICLDCGTGFVDLYLGKMSSRYCSKRCGSRAARDRRRALQRDAYVAPVSRRQIYERDRYICHLCHTKVDRTKQVPHPKAPTIDHIVPLAKGGTHEPANVATACFRCNCVKGDRGGNEQLALVG